jgi:hypothetical protein
MYKFEHNQLIIPNDIIELAFLYDKRNTLLDESTEYRVATDSEFIYYSKYVESEMELQDNFKNYVSKGIKKSAEFNSKRNDEMNSYNNLKRFKK